MRNRISLVGVMLATVMVAGLFSVAVIPQEAEAAFSGENGTIVFESEVGANEEVYSVNGDGTGQTNLTNSPQTADTGPSVSVDGARVAYKREDPRTCEAGIYVMNADGTGQSRLTSGCSAYDYDSSPSWSPDGGRLVFVRNIVGGSGYWYSEISTINVNGTERRELGTPGSGPVFSPDGTKIAYEKGYNIYVMNADGSEQTKLTPGEPWSGPHKEDPTWSPDGEKIAFRSNGGISTINADGTGQAQVSDHGARPAWSPDGEKIVFETNRGLAADYADPRSEIWTMNADGTGQTRLTTTGRNRDPEWAVSPGTAAPVPPPPPTTVITSGPAEGSTTASGSATFGFSSDREGSSFVCRLDDGPLTECSPPENVTGLAGGKHTFRVMAIDEAGRTDFTPASRTWRVEPPNRPPVARDDDHSVKKNKTLTVRRPGVLGNDRDLDGDRLSARLASRPKHGRLSFEPTGSFVYKPQRGYRGRDRFVYKASDGKGGVATAEVTIKIKANS